MAGGFLYLKTMMLLICTNVAITSCNDQVAASQTDYTIEDSTVVGSHAPSMLGVCWTAGDTLDADCLIPVQETGTNYLSQTPFGYQPHYDQPDIQTNFENYYLWGEADHGLIHTAKLAREKGMRTMLKPHLWMNTETGKWRSDLAMDSEEEWQQWFENYGAFILHYAEVAEAGDMESLCIGTELHQTVKQRPDDWRALIKEIRNVYHGELTYAANFYDEYQDVTFWDELDFIGIQGYFPLTSSENPTVEQLLAGWEDHIEDIEELAEKYGKRVVFTEIGYKSTKDAAIRPWEWPDRRSASYSDTSNTTQAVCYEAMFQAFADKEWMDGFFIWKWHPSQFAKSPEEEAARLRRIAEWKAESPQIGFTPQDKPALKVMEKWFKRWRRE